MDQLHWYAAWLVCRMGDIGAGGAQALITLDSCFFQCTGLFVGVGGSV